MAYQNVGSPRFYINVVEWLHHSDWLEWPKSHFSTLPVLSYNYDLGGYSDFGKPLPSTHNSTKGFVAILGHSLGDNNYDTNGSASIKMPNTSNMRNIVNGGPNIAGGGGNENSMIGCVNGFSIMEFDIDSFGLKKIKIQSWPHHTYIGSLVVGTYYDMPYSPDLSLTLNMEYDGVKETTSSSGATFTNSRWSRQPMWRDLGAWELSKPIQPSAGNPFPSIYVTGGYCQLSMSEPSFGATVALQQYDCEQYGGTWVPPIPSLPCCYYDFSDSWECWMDGSCNDGTPYPYGFNTQAQCENAGYEWTNTTETNPLSNFYDGCMYLEGIWDDGGEKKNINRELARSGRKTWKLTFSHIGDSSLWSPNETTAQNIPVNELEEPAGPLEDLDVSDDNNYATNIMTDDSFFSQVWHRTLNGALPFIFQPDRTDNTNFAIAQFRNNTLKVTQSAFNVYDISVIIEEVW